MTCSKEKKCIGQGASTPVQLGLSGVTPKSIDIRLSYLKGEVGEQQTFLLYNQEEGDVDIKVILFASEC